MIDRITILGGSSVYIPELVLSIISHNLNVRELVLIGRSERKLKLVGGFCQRLFDKSGFPVKVIATPDARDGLRGSTYILNNIRVGGMKARIRDEKLPPKLGMIGDEGLGAGGFANALRSLPVLFEYAAMIESICPTATLINLSSPMGICVEALSRYFNLNIIGVCDIPGAYIRRIADILKHDISELTIDYLGLNHMGWIQDVKVNGRSQMARLLDRLDHDRDEVFDHELIGLFRMVPTRRLSLYFHQDTILKKQLATVRHRAEVLFEAEQQILKLYEDPHLNDVPDLTHARNATWYDEIVVPLIYAMENNNERNVILCVRNDGAIRDLPDDCSVELMMGVSKKGLSTHKVGSCPRFLKGLFLSVKESDRLTVEAVRHKSYECALQALTINPLVPSIDTARLFLDQLRKEEGIELH